MYRTIRKILRYDTIRFIRYVHCIIRFMSTYDTPIQYRTFYTRYDDNYGAMEIALEENFFQVIIEGDAKDVFESLQIVEDTLELAKRHVQFQFNWVNRERNKVAHSLARWAFCGKSHGALEPLAFLDRVVRALKEDISLC